MDSFEYTDIESTKALVIPEGSVVTRHTDLTKIEAGETLDIDDDGLTIEELRAQEQQAQTDLEEMAKAKEALESSLKAFSEEIHVHPSVQRELKRNMDLERQAAELAMELQSLLGIDEDSIEEYEREELDDEDEDEDDRRSEAPTQEDMDRAREEAENSTIGISNRNKRRMCKSLYAKIAAKTHPDKTSDPELNAMFIEAKNMYAQQDLVGLTDVWMTLKGDAVDVRKRVRARLERLRKDLNDTHMQIRMMIASDAFKLLEVAKNRGNGFAAQCYADNVRHSAAAITMNIRGLQSQVDKAKWEKENPGKSYADHVEERNRKARQAAQTTSRIDNGAKWTNMFYKSK